MGMLGHVNLGRKRLFMKVHGGFFGNNIEEVMWD